MSVLSFLVANPWILYGAAALLGFPVGDALNGVPKWVKAIAGLFRRQSAAESALERINKTAPLTDEQLAQLTPEERDVLNHTAKG